MKNINNAGNGNRVVVVADHQGVFVDIALHAVQGLEHKGCGEFLDADLLYLAGVECVHGLTHFQHQVVGHIRQEVDGAHAAVVQPDTHIHGADADRNIVKFQAGIPQTVVIFDLDVPCG